MAQIPDDDLDERDWYEQWIRSIAGRRVSMWRLVVVWALLVGSLGGFAYAFREPAHTYPMLVVGITSGIYWFVAVPIWASRQAGK